MKKYKVQLKKFKKYHFSGENRLFRRILENSGYKNQFYWQLNHAWWLGLLYIMFLCGKQRNQGKSPIKICKNSDFRHISGIFGRKKIFSKIRLGHVLSIANTHVYGKNKKNQIEMMKSRENAKKPVFPAYFRHFRHLWSIYLGCRINILLNFRCQDFQNFSFLNLKYSTRNYLFI